MGATTLPQLWRGEGPLVELTRIWNLRNASATFLDARASAWATASTVRMFIKPLDAATLSAATFQDHSGNAHFVLQSRKQNAVRSLFSGFAALSLGSGPDASYRKSLMDYEYRIILRCPSRKADYVVAVDDTFEKIHTDWNWVERNLFLKLAEIDATKSAITLDRLDSLLIKQFEELTEEVVDPRAAEVHARLLQVKNDLLPNFPTLTDEVVLNFYACTYWLNDSTSARGQLCITRNYMCFHATGIEGAGSQGQSASLLIPFRLVTALDLINLNRLLSPDSIEISIKRKKYTFSLYFHRREVYRVLSVLGNAAMNRLIKGAENSISALSDMFGKGNVSGDLSANAGNRGGGLLTMGRSREDLSFSNTRSLSMTSDALDESDFADQTLERVNSAKRDQSDLDNRELEKTSTLERADSDPSNNKLTGPLTSAHLLAATIQSVEDLDSKLKNLEFQRLFRLPRLETIVLEEAPCHFYHKVTSNNTTGKLFLSQHYLNFVGLAQGTSAGTSIISTASNPPPLTSMLFESAQDPTLLLVVPYPHIVSVKKQAPTALPAAGKLSTFSLSGYLVLFTKNRQELWLSFGNVKSRDRVADVLLQRMKQVDFNFDDDLIIGERNGGIKQNGPIPDVGSPPATPSAATPSFTFRVAGANNSTGSLDEFIASNPDDSIFAQSIGNGVRLLQVGLGFLFGTFLGESALSPPIAARASDELESTEKSEPDSSSDATVLWNEYLDGNGRDVCMVRDLRLMRDLLTRTNGLPVKIRGDMWMICAGAWFSRPEPDYYQRMIVSHQDEKSMFAEEIEKDVRRSLPEHPAYQSPIGIDALRRLLTAYSWRNPAIGYAQALNIISAVLLLHLKEEDAFWLLCTMVESLLPDHYTKTLMGSVVDQAVLTQLVKIHLPGLSAHLEKLYMDLSTISVPWIVCLFLNTVSLKVGVKFLDAFFLDGPKFSFWLSLAILKVNEVQLIAKGRDDDIFMQILKGFFLRLALDDNAIPDEEGEGLIAPARNSNEGGGLRRFVGSGPELVDPSKLAGPALFNHLMTVAYSVFGPVVTNDTIESLRAKCRFSVVHQMEDTSRKSQIRTLCEQVSLSFDEVAVVYDELRRYEFMHEEETEDESGPAAVKKQEEMGEEVEMRRMLISFGGWGMASKASLDSRRKSKPRSKQQVQQEVGQKTVRLSDFRKVLGVVSPWRSGTTGFGSPVKESEYRPSTSVKGASIGRESVSTLRGWPSNTSVKGGNDPNSSNQSIRSATSSDEVQIGLTDRVYFYCSLHYNFLRTAKPHKGPDSQSPLAPQSVRDTENQEASNRAPDRSNYIVDLATMVHILDIIMKQPLHSRLRFLFDIHDLDGDGFLNKGELKAVMDSLLEMFERLRQEPSNQHPTGERREEEELYLGAVSSFLNTALKLGNNRGETGSSLNINNSGLKKSASIDTVSTPIKDTAIPSPNIATATRRPSGLRHQAYFKPKIDAPLGEEDTESDIGSTPPVLEPQRQDSAPNLLPGSSRGMLTKYGHRRKRSASFSSGSPNDLMAPDAATLSSSASDVSGTGTGAANNTDSTALFRLSFNEFLLAVLSQSVFVQFFERIWTLTRAEPTDLAEGSVVIGWKK
ncbi:rab-GTPase-TBC domain-containing protein [Phlyctochytrium arcticum]|nr:rab-GTPase-TBC domain-containing protein [Phlyctochytrium arcticum]